MAFFYFLFYVFNISLQVGQLDEVISTLRAELAESGHVTNDQLQNIERLQRENNAKSTKVEQLEAVSLDFG